MGLISEDDQVLAGAFEHFIPEDQKKLGLGLDKEGTAVYFCHERGRETVLDRRLLRKLKRKGAGYVVYADGCTLGEDELRELRITFRKVARDLKARK